MMMKLDEVKMDKMNLDWGNLGFALLPTDCNIRRTYRDGKWGQQEISNTSSLQLDIAATCLHYGQACFEGLKAFESVDGRVLLFRADRNASRLGDSARKICMAPVPEELFLEDVKTAIRKNARYVPPYGTGASLYIRPLLIGIEARVGVKPAEEYLFVVFVTPVGPYFKSGFKPVDIVVEEHVDRAAPNGVGNVKVAGNYAAGMRATMQAKSRNFTEVLYLDAKHKRYIDESGPANFFAITKDGTYVTPQSESILPSITNDSLMHIARDLGMKVERRPIAADELADFAEAGCCGTAAVITPVGSITWGDKKIVYSKDGKAGQNCERLYRTLCGIQRGEIEDRHNWVGEIQIP